MRNSPMLFAVVLVVICGCQSERQKIEATRVVVNGVSWVAIAITGNPNDIDIAHESLSEIGIEETGQGSVVYSIEVPESDWARAIKKLKQEPKLKGHPIRFL